MSVTPILRWLFLSNHLKLNRICVCSRINFLSSKPPNQKPLKEIDPLTGETKRKKTTAIPKITLLSGDQLQILSLLEAETISKRRGLKLVKIIDIEAKSQRPLYKLMTGSEFHAEDLKQRELRKKEKENAFIKGEKVLLINAKITQHDLETQLRKTHKWVNKMYEVRVVISGANSDASEKVYAAFEDFHQQQENPPKLVQKRHSGNDIKFQILPSKRASSTNANGDNGGKNTQAL